MVVPFRAACSRPIGVPQPPYRAYTMQKGGPLEGPLKGALATRRGPDRGLINGPIWTPKGTPIWAHLLMLRVTKKEDTESKPRTSTGRGYDYYKPI